MSEERKNEIVVQNTGSNLADFGEYGEYLGAGFDNVSASDLNTPYLIFLQGQSAQCKKGNEKSVPGAVEGDIFITRLNKLYHADKDGNTGLNAVFIQKLTLLTEWAPNRGGLRGHHQLSEKDNLGIKKVKNEKGKYILVLPNGNEVVETDYLLAVIIPTEEGGQLDYCVVSCNSTKRTAVRELYTELNNICRRVLPSWAVVYEIGTKISVKNTYSWVSPKFTRIEAGLKYLNAQGLINLKDSFGRYLFTQCGELFKTVKGDGFLKLIERTNFADYEEADDVVDTTAASEVI